MDARRPFAQHEALAQRLLGRGRSHAPVGAGSLSNIPTEQGPVLFGIVNGIFLSLAQIIAGGRLSTLDTDSVALRDMLPAVALGALGLLVGTQLVPSG